MTLEPYTPPSLNADGKVTSDQQVPARLRVISLILIVIGVLLLLGAGLAFYAMYQYAEDLNLTESELRQPWIWIVAALAWIVAAQLYWMGRRRPGIIAVAVGLVLFALSFI
jgi:cytochrome bd-type quinol oxidase subunit 2